MKTDLSFDRGIWYLHRDTFRGQPMNNALLFVYLLSCTIPALCAQAPDSGSQADTIQKLMSRIEQLEKRVTELESARAGAARAPGTAPAVRPSPEALIHEPMETAMPTYPSFKMAGFSDINFAAGDRRGTRSGFNEGQFILHINS